MASLEAGHVYVVFTTLTKPEPKDKITLCICPDARWFVWFNTKPRPHGVGQLLCGSGDHAALTTDCYLDLSHVSTFLPQEIEKARDRGPISKALRDRICELVAEGIKTLPPRHASRILETLSG